MSDALHALAGIAGLLAIAWVASERRSAVPWRAVAAGLVLQLALALLLLKLPYAKDAFLALNNVLGRGREVHPGRHRARVRLPGRGFDAVCGH